MAARPQNELYFGDNLAILREHIDDESVDLVYLDPPFKSDANYNILFRSPRGDHSHAQITAFEDTWHWGEQARLEFEDLLHQANTDLAQQIQALKQFLGENDMMAYLTMMASRLLELHRVLKPTGSIYLHCDPTASHYLKVVLDAIFGIENFRNEIIWKRTSAHSSARRWGPVHDTLLFYTRSDAYTWNQLYQTHEAHHIAVKYSTRDEFGPYMPADLTGAGLRSGESGQPWRGFDPSKLGRHWAVPKKVSAGRVEFKDWDDLTTQQKLNRLDEASLIYWPRKEDGFPRFKRYLNEGVPIQSVIGDIPPVNSQAEERIGYPTQKPLELLDRMIRSSSNEGDVVLDPFCGCGTAIHAAQKGKRRWVGIDITNLAIAIVESRLRRYFPQVAFAVHGTPKDLDGARALAERDPYEFQYWACGLVDAQPFQQKKKGSDRGIDGIKYFVDDANETCKVVVSVKSGQNISSQMVRELRGVVDREKAKVGLFITLREPTEPMAREAVEAGFYNTSTERFRRIQILTIGGLLEGTQRAQHPGAAVGLQKTMRAPRQGRDGGEARRQRELFAGTAGRVAGEVHKISGAQPRPGTSAPRMPADHIVQVPDKKRRRAR